MGLGLLIAAFLQTVLLQPFSIPSVSMEPNLVRGDYIFVSKYAYGWSHHSIPFSPPLFSGRLLGRQPERGDIVVFKLPRDGRTDYAKRLIGLPGDAVQIKSGVVYVNGVAFGHRPLADTEQDRRLGVHRVIETNLEGRSYIVRSADCNDMMDNTPLYHVPEGDYFFLGDNREDSLDSRFNQNIGVGYVPWENLEGRAELIMFSWTERAAGINVISWFTEARFERFFTSLLPTENIVRTLAT